MVPFRVFDRENKAIWIVLNFHPEPTGGGAYLLAREDDSDLDGEIRIVAAAEMTGFKLVDFLDEADEYSP